MSGAVFAAANRAPSAVGLNAPALVDEETSPSCSTTSSSGTASATAHETDSEMCESDSVTECSTSIATSQGSTTTTTTTTHLGEERPLGTCQDESETSETETESSQSGGQDHQSQELTFRMVPQSIQGAPSGYLVGRGDAKIEIQGTTIEVHAEFESMNPETHYLLLLSDGTRLGEMTTSHEGNGDIEAVHTLTVGTHAIGLSLLDISTFASQTTVMQSDPATFNVTIAQSTASESTTRHEGAHDVTTTSADEQDEENVNNALQDKTIPAVVHWTGSGASTSLLDPDFTVSVGKYQDSGLLVSISGNATGSRVIMINLTRDASPNFGSGALLVTLDGTPIQQASSFLQVLKAQPTDPARYIILSTSSGWQVLVSIPHFSLHTLAILPVVISAISNFLMVDAPLLVLSVLAVSSLFAIVYAKRPRAYL